MGDHVQHVTGIEQGPDDAFVEATSPPASDADKWFISVLTMKGCPACARLKRDWQTDENLLAFAVPGDPKASWSHFNYYASEDRSQAFRWAKLRVSQYPTVIVQAPRSGKYGNPGTVVFQDVYHGEPLGLAREMARAIKLYVQKRYERAERQGTRVEGQTEDCPDCNPGADPPWEPSPVDDELLPDDRDDAGGRILPFRIPPEDAYEKPLKALVEKIVLWVFAIGAVIAGVVGLVFLLTFFVGRWSKSSAERPTGSEPQRETVRDELAAMRAEMAEIKRGGRRQSAPL